MEPMELFLAATRGLTYVVVNSPVYSVIGCFVLGVTLLRFYCRLTVGICNSDADLTGKTVLITGGTAGIGKSTAEDLARRNARVILACRNLAKADKVIADIVARTGNKNIVARYLDLESFDSVRKCAEEVRKSENKLHILINNAGIFDSNVVITKDGCEKVLQCNHLSHFLLTLLLLDLLKKSSPSRIINVSSGALRFGKIEFDDLLGKKCTSTMNLYARSKLANVLFTRELATRLSGTGVTVNALHPGMVKTEILSSTGFFGFLTHILMILFGKTPDEGAQTSIHLAVHPDLERTTGKYFIDCKEVKLKGKATDKTVAKKLFEVSEKIVGISFHSLM